MSWPTKYIGLAYDQSEKNGHTCWSLVRAIQLQEFGRKVPDIPYHHNIRTRLIFFRDHPERQRWQAAKTPREGDCVLLAQARFPSHCGVWSQADGGGVVHAVEGVGVVWQNRAALRAHGWRLEGFYRYAP